MGRVRRSVAPCRCFGLKGSAKRKTGASAGKTGMGEREGEISHVSTLMNLGISRPSAPSGFGPRRVTIPKSSQMPVLTDVVRPPPLPLGPSPRAAQVRCVAELVIRGSSTRETRNREKKKNYSWVEIDALGPGNPSKRGRTIGKRPKPRHCPPTCNAGTPPSAYHPPAIVPLPT